MYAPAFALPVLQLCVEYKERDRDKATGKIDDKTGKKQYTGKSQTAVQFAMSMQDRDPTIAFHPDGKELRVQTQDKTRWAGCRCSAGVLINDLKKDDDTVGYAFECTVLDKDGTVRIGWSSEDASLQLGTDKDGFGYGGTGMKVNSGKYDPFPSKDNKVQFTIGDVVGCHLMLYPPEKGDDNERKDISARISFSKNGELLGDAFDIVRSNSNNQLSLYPTVCMKNTECELNFGADKEKPLRFPPPDGYQPLAESVNGEASKIVVVNPRDALSVRLEQQQNNERKGPLAIVIEPTRDLAEQRCVRGAGSCAAPSHDCSTCC